MLVQAMRGGRWRGARGGGGGDDRLRRRGRAARPAAAPLAAGARSRVGERAETPGVSANTRGSRNVPSRSFGPQDDDRFARQRNHGREVAGLQRMLDDRGDPHMTYGSSLVLSRSTYDTGARHFRPASGTARSRALDRRDTSTSPRRGTATSTDSAPVPATHPKPQRRPRRPAAASDRSPRARAPASAGRCRRRAAGDASSEAETQRTRPSRRVVEVMFIRSPPGAAAGPQQPRV